MPVQRVFLGWDQPALVAVAQWLRAHAQGPPENDPFLWDLSAWTLVVPGARAGRRLREVLVQHAGDRTLSPPAIITVGRLPELLYVPTRSLASPLVAALARAAALRAAGVDELRPLVPHPPPPDDHRAWLRLADELARLDADLASASLVPADVAPRVAAALPEFDDEERWLTLANLHDRYRALLAAHHLDDRDAARAAALSQGRCTYPNPIALVAVADLSPLAGAMLRQAAAAGTPRVTFIHAPPPEVSPEVPPEVPREVSPEAPAEVSPQIPARVSQKVPDNAFDDLGVLRTEPWLTHPIALGDERWRVVDRPRDQAAAVLEVLRELSQTASDTGETGVPFAADEITIGVGDPALADPIVRTLELAGLPARTPASGNTDANTHRPARAASLLSALARFLGSLRFDDLANLLRHPDAERFLIRTLGAQPAATGIASWLSLLDRYASEHLQGRLTGDWLGDETIRGQLKSVHDAVLDLLPRAAAARPLPHWADPVLRVLSTVYATVQLSRFDPADRALIAELSALGDVLASVAALDPDHDYVPTLAGPQAIPIILSLLGDVVVAADLGDAAIEVLGWLELPLDDAPCLIVTGFNEGLIPQSATVHALLPDHVRGLLGLTDNRRRLARDAAALTAILASRPQVTLIAGRRDADDNPLTPSRLLLACDDGQLPARIERFFTHRPAPNATAPAPRVQPDADNEVGGFFIPHPTLIAAVLDPPPRIPDGLRVTAFRDYLTCPYRFYLRHVLGLKVVDDARVEMGGDTFGSLAHEVLAQLNRDEPAARGASVERVVRRLDELLDRLVADRFGVRPAAAIALQREQLRYRLHRYAHWHVRQIADGWTTLAVERPFQAVLDIDAIPFTLTGRIDRIDRHRSGALRILDYKSADTPRSPEQVHRTSRQGNKRWCDLQLPLYRTLVRHSDITVAGSVELGYLQLPKDLSQIGFSAADWSEVELDDAQAQAQQIIRRIRAGEFWKPNDAPLLADDLSGLCMDHFPQRPAAIRTGEARTLAPPALSARDLPSRALPVSGGLKAPRSAPPAAPPRSAPPRSASPRSASREPAP
jgi:RecB family exonuclease